MGLYSSVTNKPYSGQLPQKIQDPFIARQAKERTITTLTAIHPYTKRRVEVVFVSSSNVVGASYDAAREVLTIEFKRYIKGYGPVSGGGPRYEYAGIQEATWNSFKTAASKGQWVWVILRRRGVPYRKIRW